MPSVRQRSMKPSAVDGLNNFVQQQERPQIIWLREVVTKLIADWYPSERVSCKKHYEIIFKLQMDIPKPYRSVRNSGLLECTVMKPQQPGPKLAVWLISLMYEHLYILVSGAVHKWRHLLREEGFSKDDGRGWRFGRRQSHFERRPTRKKYNPPMQIPKIDIFFVWHSWSKIFPERS